MRPQKANLSGIEALIERWARRDRVSRPLHPLVAIQLMHDGAVLGGGPTGTPTDEAAFDQCYCQAPHEKQVMVDVIYRDREPMYIAQRRLGYESRSVFYEDIDATLEYFRGAMRSKGFQL